MRTKSLTLGAAALALAAVARANSAGTIFAFGVSPTGGSPSAELVSDGAGNLYGTTAQGGDPRAGAGILFRISADGSLDVVHRFGTVPFDGQGPRGALLLVGGKLYGTTFAGGSGGRGAVFAVNPDGSDYAVLHSFGARADDGAGPVAGLSEFSGRLWGTTFSGGRRDSGTVFSIDPATGGYEVVVDLDPGSPAGVHPDEPVAFVDGEGFGIASAGGGEGRGTIFAFSPDGSSVRAVHAFGLSLGNGILPNGPLTVVGGELYGVADGGGPLGQGIVYAAAPGGGFRIVHGFGAGHGDGSEPSGAILVVDGTIYGTTAFGGAADQGVVYEIRDGGDFALLHSFPFEDGDGVIPHAGLVLAGGELSGVTLGGGEHGLGEAFAIGMDGSGYRRRSSFGAAAPDGWYPFAGVIELGGRLYGTTAGGGGTPPGSGTVFSMAKDGTDERILHAFDFEAGDGADPQTSLTAAGGVLYGGTNDGGAHGFGTIFRIEADGSGYVTLHDFAGSPSDGWTAKSLVVDGETLYGISSGGGAGAGTVFSIGTDGSAYRILHTFAGGGDGAYPQKLILIGGKLFGITRASLFSISTDGSDFRVLHAFAGAVTGLDGSLPSDLIVSNGRLYGTTRFGGAEGLGTFFAIDPDGSGYAVLRSFDASMGPNLGADFGSSLVDAGDAILVASPDAGPDGRGAVFSIDRSGGGFRLLYRFGIDPLFGWGPNAGLFLSGDGLVYGTTRAGGAGMGTIFAVSPEGLTHATATTSETAGRTAAPIGDHR